MRRRTRFLCSPGRKRAGVRTIEGCFGTCDVQFHVPQRKLRLSQKECARRKYVSSATKSVSVQVTDTKNAGTIADIYANVAAALKAVQVANFANMTGNGSIAGQCGTDPSNGGNYKCTATFQLPIGINTITITAWDAAGGTGNKLSQQISTVTTSQGAANAYAISLDANASAMTISGTAACTNGPVGASFGSVGTTPVTMSVTFTDPAGKTITAPGLPLIQILDNTSTYQSAAGTINGTGGNVSFTINQSAQTITLTPSNSAVTSATVSVKGVPANGGDGLTFAQTKSFSFSTGAAPPPSFLAVVEQTGANSGKIDLYTVTLGGSDTFSPYAVQSLATTSSLNEGKPDVDNPRAMVFDGSGDLLIANGGDGIPSDYGDFACVPAGAISTGASVSTTTSTNAKDPESIALNTDTSVVVGNVPASAAYNTVAYTLGNTYAAAPISRDISNASGTLGTFDVVAVPGAAQSGTYAAAVTDGTSTSKVVMVAPNGAQTALTDSTIFSPHALAWDSFNSQLVIASGYNNATSTAYLDFYTAAGVKVKSVLIGSDGGYSDFEGDKVAASSSGYVAVAGLDFNGLPAVQVYDGTAARGLVGGVIPFDACADPTCATFVYGTNPVVTSLKFLSGTKLLVTLSDSNMVAKQGVYIFDVTQLTSPCTCYDPVQSAQEPASPKQTGFLNFTTNPPQAAAYKP